MIHPIHPEQDTNTNVLRDSKRFAEGSGAIQGGTLFHEVNGGFVEKDGMVPT